MSGGRVDWTTVVGCAEEMRVSKGKDFGVGRAAEIAAFKRLCQLDAARAIDLASGA